MNALDYILIAVLAAFLIYGYVRGFVRQALLIVGVLVSFALAAKFHTGLAETTMFSSLRDRSDSVALVTAFVGIFFLAAAVTSTVITLIGRKVQSSKMGPGNRWLGALVGLVMGVLLLGGLALGLKEWKAPEGAIGGVTVEDLREDASGLVADSLLVPWLSDACLGLVALIPQQQQDDLTELYEEQLRVLRAGGGDGSIGTTDPGAQLSGSLSTSLVEGAGSGATPSATGERRLLNLGKMRQITRDLAREPDDPARAVPASGETGTGTPTPAIEKE